MRRMVRPRKRCPARRVLNTCRVDGQRWRRRPPAGRASSASVLERAAVVHGTNGEVKAAAESQPAGVIVTQRASKKRRAQLREARPA